MDHCPHPDVRLGPDAAVAGEAHGRGDRDPVLYDAVVADVAPRHDVAIAAENRRHLEATVHGDELPDHVPVADLDAVRCQLGFPADRVISAAILRGSSDADVWGDPVP